MATLITAYLCAIVLANVSTAILGPTASYINAFLFIGLDITARDQLHEQWKTHLVRNMALLILAGSALSAALGRLLHVAAWRVALASAAAFAASASADAVTYQILHHKQRLIKINGSNVVASLIDSIVFPTLAFGAFAPLVSLLQFLAKVAGGAAWAWVLPHNPITGSPLYNSYKPEQTQQ